MIMSDIKSILQLTQEAQVRDQPFIDTITPVLISLIDGAMTLDTEYRIEYDIQAALVSTDGPLQMTRVVNYFLTTLKTKGYRAIMSLTDLSPTVQVLVITWTVATLTKAL